MRITKHQKLLMKTILDEHDKGNLLDIDQLIDLLGHTTTKQATQCSLRFLEKKDFIQRYYGLRREKKRMIIHPTVLSISLKSLF